MSPPSEERDRRIAERRERAQKRLQSQGQMAIVGSDGNAQGIGSKQNAETDPDLIDVHQNSVEQRIKESIGRLKAFKAAEVAQPLPLAEPVDPPVDAVYKMLLDAAAHAESQANYVEDALTRLREIKNPMKLLEELLRLRREAVAAERSSVEVESKGAGIFEEKGLNFLYMVKKQHFKVMEAADAIDEEFGSAVMAIRSKSLTTEVQILKRLNERKDSRRAAFDSQLKERDDLELILGDERRKTRDTYDKALAEVWQREHAVHDALWLQLAQQATDLALQLSAAKADQIFTADKLEYNCRVLGERVRENKVVLSGIKRTLNALELTLVELRGHHAEAKSMATAEMEQMKADTQHAEHSLQSLIEKARHFESADKMELHQLVALKEANFIQMRQSLQEAQEAIGKHSGSEDLVLSAASVGALPPGDQECSLVVDDEALHENFWRSKVNAWVPEGLREKLKEMEAAIRHDLQLRR